MNNKKVFVLAPHTDDGELGCGATIANYINDGYDVYYIAFSTCSQSLPEHLPADTLSVECKNATNKLGIPESNVIFFDFEVRMLLFHRQQILEALIELNKKHQPKIVFIPAKNDVHQDHQVIYAEGMRAFKNSNLYGYELPWNNTRFQPAYFKQITKEQLEFKIAALQQYRSQAGKRYMDPQFIRSLATVRGIQANCDYAEAFEIYKLCD